MRTIVITPRVGPKAPVIFHNLDASAAQPFRIFAAHFICSSGVKHRVYFYAALRRIRQRFRELSCYLAVPKNVSL